MVFLLKFSLILAARPEAKRRKFFFNKSKIHYKFMVSNVKQAIKKAKLQISRLQNSYVRIFMFKIL